MKRTIVGLAAAAVATTALVALAAPAQAASPSNGCPSNWQLIHYLVDLPQGVYSVPAEVDSQTNSYSFGHQPGNHDYAVCALPLGNQMVGGHQMYNFMDNSLQVG
jgi:hypothetical protein